MRNTSLIIIFFIILLLPVVSTQHAFARKKGYKLKTETGKTDKNRKSSDISAVETIEPDTTSQEMVAGSFMVASQCRNCNNGYRLDQVVFTGFDKNQGNSKESFFIINNTDRTLTGVSLYIDYRTLDGRQLHKRFFKLSCNIPAGETRKADIPTWDTQRSFYYHKSKPAKHPGNPFEVIFDPIAYYLRF